MIEEMNCRSWSSRVFSFGPIVSSYPNCIHLEIRIQDETVHLVSFQKRVRLVAVLRLVHSRKQRLLLGLQLVTETCRVPVVHTADPSALDKGFVENFSEMSILSVFHRLEVL
jgi:hypothetical protein